MSKVRVKNEGVYLPIGAVTEQGNRWFAYRSHEVEFYNHYLNGFGSLEDILSIEHEDVKKDSEKPMNLHLTSVDAMRIAIALVGYGIIDREVVDFLKQKLGMVDDIPPILHPNQHYHLLKWLKNQGKVKAQDIEKLRKIMKEVKYEGD